MSTVELLEAKLVLVDRRISRLEAQQRTAVTAAKDCADLARIAREALIHPAAYQQGDFAAERRRLGRALKREGWSQSQIARALGACERTVVRWTAGAGSIEAEAA
jgi:DNA-binding NarL/FixJ family response regulator